MGFLMQVRRKREIVANTMNDEIILVDDLDNEIGYGEKLEVHQKALLHRAFSIFIFDWSDQKMLIQRRAKDKYHSGGLWTNACCSHPRKNETMEKCLSKRLKEELGFEKQFRIADPGDSERLPDGDDVIYSCGSFKYHARFGHLSEYEIDHVFLYSPVAQSFSKTDFICNPEEADALQWITIDELRKWMGDSPEEFTAWFEKAFELAYAELERQRKVWFCRKE